MNRRDFLKITAASGAIIAGGGALSWGLSRRGAAKVQDTRLLMGTIINMTVLADSRAEGRAAIDDTFAEMARLVRLFDHRQPDGPLGQLNAAGRLPGAPAELMALVRQALDYGRLSRGAFDVTVKPVVDALAKGEEAAGKLSLVDYRRVKVESELIKFEQPGMQITLDGIAKGAVVDGAVARLQALGFAAVLVEAGGDLRATGIDQYWRVAVQPPRPEKTNEFVAAFELAEQAAATSGDYMNAFNPDRSLHHIVDPRLGLSPSELASTTVIAPSATDADALSTTLMVLGVKQGLALAEKLAGVEALVVAKDLQLYRSSGFPADQMK